MLGMHMHVCQPSGRGVAQGNPTRVCGAGLPPRVLHEACPLIEPLSGDWSSKDTPRSEPPMTLPRSVADVIAHHVTWELEGIDRMYLNLYVPGLQSEGGVVHFFREHRGQPFASAAVVEPISRRVCAAVGALLAAEGSPPVTFHPRRGQEGH